MNRSLPSIAFAIAIFACRGLATVFTFDSPIAGTIAESYGLGTGFTHRLPGTGYSLPLNDPNLDLMVNPGQLTIYSTQADINQGQNPIGANLGNLEAPGIFLPNVGSSDISISALFRNVRLPNFSDQVTIYFGTSATNVVRVGLHQRNLYVVTENQGIIDMNTSVSGFDAFTPGDDVFLTFSRSAGLWQLEWENLTNPAASGASELVSLPWLDDETDVYTGVLVANPGTNVSFATQVDYFSATVVPEPSNAAMIAAGVLTLLSNRKRH